MKDQDLSAAVAAAVAVGAGDAPAKDDKPARNEWWPKVQRTMQHRRWSSHRGSMKYQEVRGLTRREAKTLRKSMKKQRKKILAAQAVAKQHQADQE